MQCTSDPSTYLTWGCDTLDLRFTPQDFNPEFGGTEKYQNVSCVHGHTPARRICREGFEIGRRFLNFPLEVSAHIGTVNALCSTGLMAHTNIYYHYFPGKWSLCFCQVV